MERRQLGTGRGTGALVTALSLLVFKKPLDDALKNKKIVGTL